jgi:hypothetical protein
MVWNELDAIKIMARNSESGDGTKIIRTAEQW